MISAAGKEGATRLVQFLESKAGQSKVFVDIRPHLDISVVERAKELGWQAHTVLGNARNDHALVTGITNYLRVPTPSFARIRTTCIRGVMNVGASAHEDNVSAVGVTPRGVVTAVKPRLCMNSEPSC